MLSRWQHQSFPTLVTLTRSPTGNHSQTRHHCGNRNWEWGWSMLPGLQRQRRRTSEGKRSSYTLTTLPSFPGCTALHQEWPFAPMIFPVGETAKEDIRFSPHCRVLPRRPIALLPHWNHWGNLQGFNHADWEWRSGCSLQQPALRSRWISFLLAIALEPGALPICN